MSQPSYTTIRTVYAPGESDTLALVWHFKLRQTSVDWRNNLVNDIDPWVHSHLQYCSIWKFPCRCAVLLATWMDGPPFVQAKDFLLHISCTPNIECLMLASGYSAINPFIMIDAQNVRVHYDIGEGERPSKP